MDNPQVTEQRPAEVEVTILVDSHAHNGQPVKKGDKIKVTSAERDWLANLNIIKK